MNQSVCPLCRRRLQPRWDQILDSVSHEIFSVEQCPDCGLGVTQGVPAELGGYYQQGYHGGRHGITTNLCDRRRLRIVEAFRPSDPEPRLLDVGCGEGTFLLAAQRRGWQVWGMEKYPELARANLLPILDDLDQAAVNAPYDCVSLWHVLEHLEDLGGTIRTIERMLDPDGVVVIAVPNAASLQATLFGNRWLHLDVPRHLYHFTERSLRELLHQQGFQVVYIRYSEFEYDLLGWVQSLFNSFGIRPNTFFKILTGRQTHLSRIGTLAHFLCGSILCGIGCLPILVGGGLGLGSTLLVVARRNSESEIESETQ